MILENKNGLRVLYPDKNCKIYSQVTNSYHDLVYLGIHDKVEEYTEVKEEYIEGYEPKSEVDKINIRLEEIKKENINILSTAFELDFRVFELECFLEDSTLFTNKSEVGKRTMTLTPYEIAKKLILLGEYDKFNMKYKLERYKDRGAITEEQYDRLITLLNN